MNRWRQIALAALALALAGCSGEAAPNTRGVYLLMDTSGTYTRELDKAQALINALLAKLEPGDSFAVARVDTGSFSERDIVARVTFDERPSMTNQQKRKFREEIDQFVRGVKPASFTDITGGILQAAEYLNEKNPGRKTVLIFSDLKEELKDGYVRDIPLTVDGFEVIAINVTKLALRQRRPARVHDPARGLAAPGRGRRRHLAGDQRPRPPGTHPGVSRSAYGRRVCAVARSPAANVASVTAHSAAKVRNAFAAWAYSHRRRSSCQSAGTTVQLTVAWLAGKVQMKKTASAPAIRRKAANASQNRRR